MILFYRNDIWKNKKQNKFKIDFFLLCINLGYYWVKMVMLQSFFQKVSKWIPPFIFALQNAHMHTHRDDVFMFYCTYMYAFVHTFFSVHQFVYSCVCAYLLCAPMYELCMCMCVRMCVVYACVRAWVWRYVCSANFVLSCTINIWGLL